MGNIIANIQQRIVVVDDVPIPPMQSLTENQVEIIKKSWAIPFAKVSS